MRFLFVLFSRSNMNIIKIMMIIIVFVAVCDQTHLTYELVISNILCQGHNPASKQPAFYQPSDYVLQRCWLLLPSCKTVHTLAKRHSLWTDHSGCPSWTEPSSPPFLWRVVCCRRLHLRKTFSPPSGSQSDRELFWVNKDPTYTCADSHEMHSHAHLFVQFDLLWFGCDGHESEEPA